MMKPATWSEAEPWAKEVAWVGFCFCEARLEQSPYACYTNLSTKLLLLGARSV